jgi:hypothetical protein
MAQFASITLSGLYLLPDNHKDFLLGINKRPGAVQANN